MRADDTPTSWSALNGALVAPVTNPFDIGSTVKTSPACAPDTAKAPAAIIAAAMILLNLLIVTLQIRFEGVLNIFCCLPTLARLNLPSCLRSCWTTYHYKQSSCQQLTGPYKSSTYNQFLFNPIGL